MAFFRWAALLALAFWIGGLVTLGGVTAPVLFETLEAANPAGGRELAAVVFGGVFTRFQYFSWIAAAVVIGSLAARAALGPRPRWWRLRMWVGAGMLAASLATVFLVAPRIDAIRNSVAGPVATLEPADERRVAFGRWHAVSTGLMAFVIVCGAGLVWAEATDRH
jgi:hypothetical protein